jgi:sugar phosphate isomerase/epimerase
VTAAPPLGLRYGYGTNGLADHRLDDGLAFLADCGYQGVAITLDHHHLDPFGDGLSGQVRRLRRRLDQLGLAVVIETGARFLLDPRAKHQPTLVSAEADGRRRRLDLLRRAVAVGSDLGAEAVSFWSGTAPPGSPFGVSWRYLADGCAVLVGEAERAGARLGLEPEPGMLLDRVGLYERLWDDLGRPPALGLTVDVGHLLCGEPEPPGETIRRAGPRIVNVQIEDMRTGVHSHLDFGEGDVDFPAVLGALAGTGYAGLVSVELPRHSHCAHETVPRAIRFLRKAEQALARR